jgi:hypothetical protein
VKSWGIGRGGDVAWGGAYVILGVFFCLAFVLFDSLILLGAWIYGLPMIFGGYAVLSGGIDGRPGARQPRTSPIARQQPYQPETKRKVWARDGGACALCQRKADLRFGLISPESEGGVSVANLRVICGTCEQSLGISSEMSAVLDPK